MDAGVDPLIAGAHPQHRQIAIPKGFARGSGVTAEIEITACELEFHPYHSVQITHHAMRRLSVASDWRK